MHNASTVTLIVLRHDQGSDAVEDEVSKIENIPTADAASGVQATNRSTKVALTEFHVHENLICESSAVMKAAFQGRFAEAGSKTMFVRDLDVDMVQNFIQWLYGGRTLPPKPGTKDEEQSWYLQMARMVVVADIWRVEDLEDDVIDVLTRPLDAFVDPPGSAVARFVYENTGHLSYLRRWVVAWYTEYINFEWYKEDLARDFIAKIQCLGDDIAMALGKDLAHPKPKSFFDMNRKERRAPVDLVLKYDAK